MVWVREGRKDSGIFEEGMGRGKMEKVARFRMSNEMGEAKCWEEKEKKMCRICEGKIETWKHVWEECAVDMEENGL